MRGASPSGWIGPITAFFLGAVLVSVLDGPLLVGLLVGVAAALAWRPLRRDPPWTARGRLAWRTRLAGWAQAWRAWSSLGRSWGARTGRTRDTWAEAVPVDPADEREAARFQAAFRVRCEVVTDRMQVWHSTGTGRAYEVAWGDAPADARPGDDGWLSFAGGRPTVRPSSPRERALN